MRELGFSKEWDKLKKPVHTTFRLPRKDSVKGRDWKVGEVVKEVFRTRSKQRKVLQVARIISKETKVLSDITDAEAIDDGFPEGRVEMWRWLWKSHDIEKIDIEINKLTLEVLKEDNTKVDYGNDFTTTGQIERSRKQ